MEARVSIALASSLQSHLLRRHPPHNSFLLHSLTFSPSPSLGGSYVYELSAVLIHRGVSAYSGHYIAHVKDPQSGEWYKFNDEDIEKMEGKKLQLGIEEDLGKTFKL